MTSQLKKLAESMVGAYRAESTDQYTAGSGITTKIPPLFDGSTSRPESEELIDDRMDLTVPEAEKRGPALKNRFVGDAEMFKELLNRESLRAADGVKYFKDTLRPHFIKGVQSVFLWRFYLITRSNPIKNRKHRDGQVDRQVFTALETLEGCLDGHATVVRPE